MVGFAERGVGLHFATVITACTCFLFLSEYCRKRGVTSWNNVLFASMVTYASMFVFEWPYTVLYDLIHNGGLVGGIVTYGLVGEFKWYNVLFQNTFGFVVPLVVMWVAVKPYFPRFKLSKLKVLVWAVVAAVWLLWVFYPFPTETATSTLYGLSKGGGLFPQNVYIWYSPVTHELTDQMVFHNMGVFIVNFGLKALTTFAFAVTLLFKTSREAAS
ncbi:MAG: hypothetical protein HWN68_08365 [Desulfobacterales bacterium]|nr:hypothetical protein [Desulfobacterales bacterium]